MSTSSASTPGPRIGLRAVAAAAGVCLQTASLALRNSPRLSQKTGRRVRAIAARLGYRPDPEISRLMGRLRPSRKLHRSVVIAMIDLHREKKPTVHPYDRLVRQGITRRAEALGYGVALFSLSDYGGELEHMLRVVRHRGIVGAILLPSSETLAFDPTLRWEGISVVAATTTVTAPQFHQVIPNQLHNMLTLIESVRRRGFQRLGALLTEELERRTHHHYSMALTWHGHGQRVLVLPDGLAETDAIARIQAWLREHRPDVIFAGDALTRLLAPEKRPKNLSEIAVVSLTSRSDKQIPHLDQRPALIGECAVSLLTGMMHNHETGIPPDPQVTTIRGQLREPDPAA